MKYSLSYLPSSFIFFNPKKCFFFLLLSHSFPVSVLYALSCWVPWFLHGYNRSAWGWQMLYFPPVSPVLCNCLGKHQGRSQRCSHRHSSNKGILVPFCQHILKTMFSFCRERPIGSTLLFDIGEPEKYGNLMSYFLLWCQ